MKPKVIEVYLEVGQKRTFAMALDWPGWCRSGKNEEAALQALFDYGSRYRQVLQGAKIDFHAPTAIDDLVVVEKLKGNATTDFGAPDRVLERDSQPVEPAELERWQQVLNACWQSFDQAVAAASGYTLRKGPRGGGRSLSEIIQHVQAVNSGYLQSLGGKVDSGQPLPQIREAILMTLTAAVQGEIPAHGPRGGVRWTPRYFVRRLAWHELDHTWEIEDRVEK